MHRLMDNARRALRGLLRDTRGTVAIITVASIPVVAGFTGLGVDATYWYMVRLQLQTAADAGAVSGSLELVRNNPTVVVSAAKKDAVRNGADPSEVTVNRPPTSGSYAGDTTAVEVIVKRQMPLFFSSILLDDPVTIVVRSVATSTVVGQPFAS